MPAKTEVYTWRLAAERKARLEERARMTGRSLAQVLDELVDRGLDCQAEDEDADRERQRALHDRARRHVGSMMGGGDRRSERVRELVRTRLRARRRGR